MDSLEQQQWLRATLSVSKKQSAHSPAAKLVFERRLLATEGDLPEANVHRCEPEKSLRYGSKVGG
jgi:hypothetical protein